MGRNTNQVITFNDAIYMRDNEGYTQKQAIPASSQVMTKTEIEAYLYVDNSLFSTYATNRAVPYQKIAIGAVPDTTSPTYTSNLTLGTITSTSIQLNWVSTDNVGVTSHTVYVNNSVHATIAGNATTYTVTGLSPSTAYAIYVRATDAAGNFQNSIQHGNATTSAAPDTAAPTFPTQPYSNTQTQTSVTVQWASSDNFGVTSQVLYWKTSIGGSYSTINLSSSATSYTKTGLTAGTLYNFYIRACDAAGNCSNSQVLTQQAQDVPADTTYPTYPTQLSVSSFNTNSVQLGWNSTDNVGVTSQVLYWKVSGGSYATTTLSSSATSYTKTGLSSNTLYYFFVRSCDAAGNCTDSTTVSQTTQSTGATVTVSPPSFYASDAGDIFFLTITTTAAWTLTDDAAWIDPVSFSGTGNASVRIDIDPISRFETNRFGTITVSVSGASDTCNVSQGDIT